MKIALLNDTHFGCRNDSPDFFNYQNRFFDEIFFPYIQENKITTLIHLGDVVDRRKFINFQVAHNFQKKFWKRLWDLKIDTHIILGNHDTYYKNTNEVNSMEQLITTFDGINEPWIYTKPKTVNFDGLDILFLPWICDETYEESIHAIDDSTAQICMGHLEIKGFEMHKGHLNEQGLDKEQFKRFEKVLSGHFHRKSDDGHIFYLGTQYEITWSDYKCPKGFHVFDTSTRELERIPNPLRIHKKLIYNDKQEDYSKKDLKPFENTFVKLIISNKTNTDIFDKLVDRFHNEINVHELNIIEDLSSDINTSVREDILEQGEDTLTFLGNYVDQIDTKLDRSKLKTFIKKLYAEANDQ
jgi:DNA repair exonuclease SbcCD nuclease subunit